MKKFLALPSMWNGKEKKEKDLEEPY